DTCRGAWPCPQDVAADRPARCLTPSTDLPCPGPRPRQPWARGRPYEPVSVRPTPCLRARLQSISHRARSACTVRVWIGAGARSSASPPRASRVTLRRVREAPRCALKRALHQARSSSCRMPAAVRGLVLRTWLPPAQLRCLSPSTSLPYPGPRPRRTVDTRSALRAALRHANSLPTSRPSIARTSCAPRARCVSGSGPWQGQARHHDGLLLLILLDAWARPRTCHGQAHDCANRELEISSTSCSPSGQLRGFKGAFDRPHLVRSACSR